MLVVCFTVALFIPHLGSLARKNLFEFLRFRAGVKLNSVSRKIIKSRRPAGFSMGPYGIMTSKLGLCICDDIIRNTVSMILLS